MQIQSRTARPTTSAFRSKTIIKRSANGFSAGRRPEPLPRLFPLSQRHRLQPGDLCLRLVVSARNNFKLWMELTSLYLLSSGSMWTVTHLQVSTEQLRVPLAALEVAPTRLQLLCHTQILLQVALIRTPESARLPLLEEIVLALSATAGARDRGTQVLFEEPL